MIRPVPLSSLLVSLVLLSTGCAVGDRIKSDLAVERAATAHGERDYTNAARDYEIAAEAGNAHAQYMLSWLYEEGKGVTKSRENADKWLEKAAAANFPPANVSLGLRKLFGQRGHRRDPAAAYPLLLKAAEGNDDTAMFVLGLMHLRGTGVRQNADEALRWFQLADSAGYPVDERLLTADSLARLVKRGGKTGADDERNVQAQRETTRRIQQALAERGYSPGVADGLFGAKTRAAIEAFEKDRNLPVRGRPTPAILRALEE